MMKTTLVASSWLCGVFTLTSFATLTQEQTTALTRSEFKESIREKYTGFVEVHYTDIFTVAKDETSEVETYRVMFNRNPSDFSIGISGGVRGFSDYLSLKGWQLPDGALPSEIVFTGQDVSKLRNVLTEMGKAIIFFQQK